MKRYSYHLRLLALAWAGVLLVGATACGDGDDPNETPEPPATQPVLIDGKFSSWNSTSADGIFDDGAAIGLFAVEGAFTADAPRYINNARLTLKEGLFRSAASLMLKPSAGTLAAYTPHADRMPLAGTTATVTAAADQSAAADFAAADFMAATALVPADQQGAVQMTFHRMFSRIDLSFTTAGEPTLDEFADAKVTLTLDLSADVDFATGSVTGSSNPQTTTPNGTLVPDGSTIKGLSAIVAPQRIAADEAVLNLKVGTFEASYPLGKELTLKAGMQYDFAITVGQAVPDITVTVDVTEHEWTEGTSVEETVEVDDNMPKSITDIEGNSYPVVKIGTQYWMAANLATTRYNDGTPITRMDDAEMWTNNGTTRTDAYCYPNGESANVGRYGLIYNYYAVATNKLCPEGWHIPTSFTHGVFGNYYADMEYIDYIFGFDWWHMMASNVAENKDSRDWVAAQWWKSGDNTPDNLSGLSLYAVPALGQTTGFGKTNTPKFNSTELEGTVLFWVDILSKGIPMLPYLDGDNDMINNNVSAAAVGACYFPIRCVRD